MSDFGFRRVVRVGLAPLMEGAPEGPSWADLTSTPVVGDADRPVRFAPWLVGVGSAILVLILVGVAAWLGGNNAPPLGSTTTPGAVVGFQPPTRTVDGETWLDLTLIDGSQITLAYPRDLDMTSRGVEASAVGGVGTPNRQIEVRYETPAEFITQTGEFSGPGELTHTYEGPDGGTVERWEFSDIAYLVFDFEPWTATVWDTKTYVSANAEGWAANLHGTVTPDGFLTLSADSPLSLVPSGVDPRTDGPDIRVEGSSGSLLIFINDCDRMTLLDEETYGQDVFAFCDEPTNTLFFVSGTAEFQQRVHETLRVNPEELTTTTTSVSPTTTTEPLPPYMFAPTPQITQGQATLPIAFLDGTTARLTWPTSLDLLSSGVGTSGWGAVNDLGSNTARTIIAIPESREMVIDRFGTGEVLATYADGRGGLVQFRRFPVDTTVDYLVFDFGGWTVLVYDYQKNSEGRMTEASREIWSSHLSSSITADGFLVLVADPPLILAGAGESPPVALDFNPPGGSISMTLTPCVPNQTVEDEPNSLSWCNGSGEVSITVHSINVEFRNSVRASLVVSDIERP